MGWGVNGVRAERVEDVVLNRVPQYKDGEARLTPGERLIEVAETAKGAAKDDSAKLAWRAKPVDDRLSHALVHGTRHRGGGRGGMHSAREAAT